ncbi:CYTH domain-containing protein [Marinilactibacillus sp. Marseille-P9653]|uniref:CYTH domain-containing protein n=1 Tax=Marinilactibacillus sp. Marseille-P9653 TaxID=2866583 RepID=UPI001CE445BC|nr:CYTH domain-containing protein [Marinilactibacillus sp. Marseille-P9653]
MSQNVEIEYKNLLTELEYEKLIKAFEINKAESFTQENIYFDSKEMVLKENQLALRIRIKDDVAEMTLKSPHEGHLLETNESLTIERARALVEKTVIYPTGQIADLLASYGIDSMTPLYIIAQLRTQRLEKKVHSCLIVLDKSWYGDQIDYELEIESTTSTEGKQFIKNLLTQYDIPERDTPNKISRAVQDQQKRTL